MRVEVTAVDTSEFQRLVSHLGGMRQGLAEYASGQRRGWPTADQCRHKLLERYDAGLIQAARLLQLTLRSETVAGEREREELEVALAAAAVELQLPRPVELRSVPLPPDRDHRLGRTSSDENVTDPGPAAVDLRHGAAAGRSALAFKGPRNQPM